MQVPYEAAQALAQLSGVVLGTLDVQDALTRVAETATEVVPRCDGTSVTLREHGVPTATAASDGWSTELDRVQVEEQEGPCLDCMREGSLQRVRDLSADGRFPSYGPRAAGLGARSALSVPLSSDGRTVGALNLYSREPDAFDTDAVALGTLLAAHASFGMQAATAYFSSRALAAQLQEALSSRAAIEQAKGILMAQQRCSPEAAFRLLVEQSQRANTKLRDVALELVARTSRS